MVRQEAFPGRQPDVSISVHQFTQPLKISPSHIFVKKLVVFRKHQKVFNPSRVDPCLLTVFDGNSGRRTISVIDKANSPAIAVSVVSVGECHLQRSYRLGNKYTKYITGSFLSQEDLLFQSTVLMALGLQQAAAGRKGDYFTFSCRPLPEGSALLFLKYSSFLQSSGHSNQDSNDKYGPVSPSKLPYGKPSVATSTIQSSIGSQDKGSFLVVKYIFLTHFQQSVSWTAETGCLSRTETFTI